MTAVEHAPALRGRFGDLVVGVAELAGVATAPASPAAVERLLDLARARLATAPESTWPQVVAWRRAFASLGLRPTACRCAAEQLLRRLRREGDLPRLHPLVDLTNALSAAHGLPVAVFDDDRVEGRLLVTYADGTERYTGLDGTTSHPAPGEVVFRDDGWTAHARRWTHRQAATSAVAAGTDRVTVVVEALHPAAAEDVSGLLAQLVAESRRRGLHVVSSEVRTTTHAGGTQVAPDADR